MGAFRPSGSPSVGAEQLRNRVVIALAELPAVVKGTTGKDYSESNDGRPG